MFFTGNMSGQPSDKHWFINSDSLLEQEEVHCKLEIVNEGFPVDEVFNFLTLVLQVGIHTFIPAESLLKYLGHAAEQVPFTRNVLDGHEFTQFLPFPSSYTYG
jgi:hypothetical protein